MRYFVKAVAKLPIVETATGKVRPGWTEMGDGLSYFMTDNEPVAEGLKKLADMGKNGLVEVTKEELAEKKTVAHQRQEQIDARRLRENPFRNPGQVKQSVRGQHQTSVKQTDRAIQSLSDAKKDVVVKGRQSSTIDREKSVNAFEKGQTPVIDADRPEATKPADVAGDPVSSESPPY